MRVKSKERALSINNKNDISTIQDEIKTLQLHKEKSALKSDMDKLSNKVDNLEIP